MQNWKRKETKKNKKEYVEISGWKGGGTRVEHTDEDVKNG